MKHLAAGAALLGTMLLLSACGQRGPLVLPEPKARPPAAESPAQNTDKRR